MFKKLRNQPYAPKWEQEEEKIMGDGLYLRTGWILEEESVNWSQMEVKQL
jgi:hypothetical protein